MKHIFLSPHFDDAIGSCGGLINRLVTRGDEVTVITVFAHIIKNDFSDFAKELNNLWNLKSPVEERIIENKNACEKMNIKYLNLDFTEAIYRKEKSKYLYPLSNDIFKDIVDEDSNLKNDIFDILCKYVKEDDLIYVPSSIGNHVDHKIVCEVGKMLTNTNKVIFYEDFSYEGSPNIAKTKIVKIKLSDEELFAKIEAVKEYKSQIEMLFGSIENIKLYYEKKLDREEIYYE